MADESAQIQIDAIVQAISFGITSDFRDLRQGMYDVTMQAQENNRLLGETNSNLTDIERSLDQFEKDAYRRKDSREFKRLEDKLERKARENSQRGDEMMQKIMSAVTNIKASAGTDRNFGDQRSVGDASQVDLPDGSGPSAPGPASKGSGIGKAIAATAAVAAVGAIGVATMAQGEEQSPNLAPAPTPTPKPNPPSPARPAASLAPQAAAPAQIADQLAGAGNANFSTSSIASSASMASQSIGAITETSKQKAASKVISKVPNWLSRNGSRIESVIGGDSMHKFGMLVGNNFSFRKFFSSDAWTLVGAEYVAGRSPSLDTSTEAKYVSAVTTTLAIEAYLAAREIYSEENFVSIENGIVPNFDALEPQIRTQVVKDVGNQIESFVNRLISGSVAAQAQAQSSKTSSGAGSIGGSGAAPAAAAIAGGGTASAAGGGGSTGGSGGGTAGPAPASGSPELSPTYDSYKNMPTQSGMTVAKGPGAAPSKPDGPAMTVAKGPGPYIPGQRPVFDNTMERESSAYVSGNTPLSSSGAGAAFSSTAAEYMPRLMSDFGLTEEQAAGIIGNLGHESAGMQAGIQEYGKAAGTGGLGWAQWTGVRRRAFENFLAENGMSSSDPEANYAFLKHELQTTEAGALEKLRSAKTAGDATLIFEKAYERAGVKAYDQRIDYANKGLEAHRAKQAAAQEATVQPLPSDASAGVDMSNALAPTAPAAGTSYGGAEGDEETSSSEVMPPADARNKQTVSGPDPKEEERNQIANYHPYMDHVFGIIADEMKTHMNGEITTDSMYEQSMHALA